MPTIRLARLLPATLLAAAGCVAVGTVSILAAGGGNPRRAAVATLAEAEELSAQPEAVRVTVGITSGKITGTVGLAAGTASFNPQGDRKRLRGALEWTPAGGSVFASAEITAMGIAADLKSGWFAGIGRNGRSFVAYVEDNGEPGKSDVFKLWIGGTLVTGDSTITSGNVQFHRTETGEATTG
jgi:hypothetical protein